MVCEKYLRKILGQCQWNWSWLHNISEITNTITTSKIWIGVGIFDDVNKTGHGQDN